MSAHSTPAPAAAAPAPATPPTPTRRARSIHDGPSFGTFWLGTIAFTIFLKIVLGTPIIGLIVFVGTLYFGHIVYQGLQDELETLLGLMKFVAGVGLYVYLRFCVGKLLGIMPVHTADAWDTGGGLFGLFTGYDVSWLVLWEVGFAIIMGALVASFMNGKGRILIGGFIAIFMIIATVAMSFPKSVATIPSKAEMDDAYSTGNYPAKFKSAVLDTLKGVEKSAPKTEVKPAAAKPVTTNKPAASVARPQGNTNTPAASTAPVVEDTEYPKSGSSVVTLGGLRVYLDTHRSETHSGGPVRYVNEDDGSVLEDMTPTDQTATPETVAKWRNMKSGRYIVYPIGADQVIFTWSVK